MSIDAQILTALRANSEGAVSGMELSQKLGVSRAAIWARIEDLRSLGYEIEATPHRGYRLLSAPDVLHADDLFSRLGEVRVIGRDIRVFQETTSTNDVMEKLARDGVKEGVVAFAESQSKGRGRLGRTWISPARKGLWFSFLLRPNLNPQQTTQLIVATATALRRAIQIQANVQPAIKWPNDILVNGRKVAGILTELNAELDHIKYVIVGVGIDVNHSAEDFPPELRGSATSLKLESGKTLSRAELAVEVLRQLDSDYERLITGKFSEIAEEWEKHCITLGQTVVIRVGDRRIRGRGESISEDGALLLRTEHGHLERIIGGDVSIEKT
jgi:BirA family transcriptional regulator, biotin operon repressor / biotin---[acetyl-CoA-carboxylase] ligase